MKAISLVLNSEMASLSVHDVIDAANEGNIEKMKYYLKNYTNITKVFSSGNSHLTALRHAIWKQNYDMCKLLIDHGAEPSGKHYFSPPDLHVAAKAGNYKVFKLILKNSDPLVGESRDGVTQTMTTSGSCGCGSHVSEKQTFTFTDDSIYSLLCYAVNGGNIKIIDRVLNATGLDINKIDSYGKSGLHCACISGRLDIIKHLINRGADINVHATNVTKVPNSSDVANNKYIYGCTPLHCAVLNNYPHIVSYLLNRGADLKIGTQKFEYRSLSKIVNVESKSIISSATNIHIKYIISKHIEINNLDICPPMNKHEKLVYEDNLAEIEKNGLTGYEYADDLAILALMLNRYKIFKYLVKNKYVDINSSSGTENTYRPKSFLYTACKYARNKNYDLIEYILSSGFNLEFECGGVHSLHYLTQNIKREVGSGIMDINLVYDPLDPTTWPDESYNKLIKLLISNNIEPDLSDFKNICRNGDYTLAKYFINYFEKNGKLVEIIKEISLHDFRYGRKNSEIENIIRLLWDHGMKINKKDKYSKLSYIDSMIKDCRFFDIDKMRIFTLAISHPDAKFDVGKLMQIVKKYDDPNLYKRRESRCPADDMDNDNHNAWATYIPTLKTILKSFTRCETCDEYVNTCYVSMKSDGNSSCCQISMKPDCCHKTICKKCKSINAFSVSSYANLSHVNFINMDEILRQ